MTLMKLFEDSEYFDAVWYVERYPDVDASGMTPVEHYVEVGEPLGRAPGPEFSPSWYLARYPDVASSDFSPLEHFIRRGKVEGRQPRGILAAERELELWEGAAEPATCLQSLEALWRCDEPGMNDPWEASYAAWALGRWYAWQGNWSAVVEYLALLHDIADRQPAGPAPLLLEVEALVNIGDLLRAHERLRELSHAYPNYHDTHLAMANLLAAQAHQFSSSSEAGGFREPAVALNERLRLDWINAPWREAGLVEVHLRDGASPLSLDNLDVEPGSEHEASERVSVIMPVFNAESTLATALSSLLAQTHAALEILVVDDASTDASLAVAEAFAAEDSRVRVLPQQVNLGAYTARNRGLSEATGEFWTVHDSDDWSHPQKLALQVAGMHEHDEWVACSSDWVRCTPELTFHHWRMEEGWIYRNTSSLLFRRRVFETLGFWDRVRVNGDTEYLHRVRAAFGRKAVGEVAKGVPLTFGRSHPDSLSQAGPTHLCTQFKGLRRDYQEAAMAWHACATHESDLYLPAWPDERPFEAPAANLPDA
ncbi:glycosyltransferase family 2 protein [Halomonas sp. 18H]|uniref:glycosyltransferase family 2 protein n=1 Tax=Halomonas almeriensis TaxID=308163 RepID=UPI0022309A45|nr:MULTISPECIES: glycosyltransferase family A protein [Halomonas]MCW4151719.1 glycosyltransferase family 2 protein [Halomonas sp. 18H]MDN3553964.1 glycosyltransferase family A protein [Halomonas almeriensis]